MGSPTAKSRPDSNWRKYSPSLMRRTLPSGVPGGPARPVRSGAMEAVRYGVIGTGMMGVEHISNLLAIDGVEVTALADPDERSLDQAHHAVGTDARVARFVDHRDLISSGACDAVVIATPNHTHHDVLLDVLASPLHVLVEKPLCTTVGDCQDVVEAAAGGPAGRVVWMGLEYRYMPPTQRLLAEVRGGTVGDVKMVAVREHRFPFLHKVGNWNRFNRNTGGTLVEKCCHYFDLMNLVVGTRPRRVMASGGQAVNHLDESYDGEVPDIIDNAYVVVEYAGGVRAMLDLCMFAEASRNEQELCVVGDEGKVEALVSEGILRVGPAGRRHRCGHRARHRRRPGQVPRLPPRLQLPRAPRLPRRHPRRGRRRS